MSNRDKIPADIPFLRGRARRITRGLEHLLGVPRPKGKPTAPIDMLIGTLLSQNTNDRNSYRAYKSLRMKYPSWKEVADARTAGIAAAIRVGGMANQKSRRIKELLRDLNDDFDSFDLQSLRSKSDDEAIAVLTSYRGIGVKTAACVLLFSFRKDVFPVDTHVHRICNRLGLVHTKTPEKTFLSMKSLFPAGKAYSLHTNLIRFGRTICLARNPRCENCPFYDECQYPAKRRRVHLPDDAARHRGSHFMLLDHL